MELLKGIVKKTGKSRISQIVQNTPAKVITEAWMLTGMKEKKEITLLKNCFYKIYVCILGCVALRKT